MYTSIIISIVKRWRRDYVCVYASHLIILDDRFIHRNKKCLDKKKKKNNEDTYQFCAIIKIGSFSAVIKQYNPNYILFHTQKKKHIFCSLQRQKSTSNVHF